MRANLDATADIRNGRSGTGRPAYHERGLEADVAGLAAHAGDALHVEGVTGLHAHDAPADSVVRRKGLLGFGG